MQSACSNLKSSLQNSLFDIIYAARHKISRIWNFFAAVNLVAFLHEGKYPSLVYRLLGAKQYYQNPQVARQISFEYMNRQLLWHGLTEFMTFIVPIIPFQSWKRGITWTVDKITSPFTSPTALQQPDVANMQCGICQEEAHTPYETSCNHIFCYYCIQSHDSDDCPTCQSPITCKKRLY